MILKFKATKTVRRWD